MANVQIETLTPIHVGSGVKLQPNIEFLVFGNEIAVIDDEKVLSIIGEENIAQWIGIIQKKESLLPYLQKRKPNLKAEDIALRIIHNKEKHKVGNEIHSQIHNGFGLPYLPGSSIKGAIRTAVFANIARKAENKATVKAEIGKNDKFLQKKLIGNDPNTDPFRFLQPGDAHFEKTEFLELKIANVTNYGWEFKIRGKATSQFVECIPAKAVSEIRLKFQDDVLRNVSFGVAEAMKDKLKATSVLSKNLLNQKQLFKDINAHTLKVLDLEIDELETVFDDNDILYDYQENMAWIRRQIKDLQGSETECILRLGFGTGYHSITGGWKKEVTGQEELLGHGHSFAGIYPKTRRFTASGDPLGFLKLKVGTGK